MIFLRHGQLWPRAGRHVSPRQRVARPSTAQLRPAPVQRATVRKLERGASRSGLIRWTEKVVVGTLLMTVLLCPSVLASENVDNSLTSLLATYTPILTFLGSVGGGVSLYVGLNQSVKSLEMTVKSVEMTVNQSVKSLDEKVDLKMNAVSQGVGDLKKEVDTKMNAVSQDVRDLRKEVGRMRETEGEKMTNVRVRVGVVEGMLLSGAQSQSPPAGSKQQP